MSLNVYAADMAVGPAPIITIFLVLSMFFYPRTGFTGFFSHPVLGTEITTFPLFF